MLFVVVVGNMMTYDDMMILWKCCENRDMLYSSKHCGASIR